MKDTILKALVQNYGFRETKVLPTIDYVYPAYTADGNTEAFRFSSNLRRELAGRASLVKMELEGKEVVWTPNHEILSEIDAIAPRLGINDQLTGKINSIYCDPLLFVAPNERFGAAYVVKPILDGREMAWFEFTQEEHGKVTASLVQKAYTKPYQSLFQRMLGRLSS